MNETPPRHPDDSGRIGTDEPSGPTVLPGASAPDFELYNADGELVSLAARNGAASVVLLFYRDGACPVCKAALRAYQRRLPTFSAAGARVLALSRESRSAALGTARDNGLDFEFLSDIDGKVAQQFGITYEYVVDNRTVDAEAFDRSDAQQMREAPLPVPASFIIGSNRKVIAATAHPGDLLDPDNVVTTLRALPGAT